MEETRLDIEQTGLISTIIGHVGDGNFHCLPMCMPDDQETQDKIQPLQSACLSVRLISAGPVQVSMAYGQGKQSYLRAELGEAVEVMESIKQTLDPKGIMNLVRYFQQVKPERWSGQLVQHRFDIRP